MQPTKRYAKYDENLPVSPVSGPEVSDGKKKGKISYHPEVDLCLHFTECHATARGVLVGLSLFRFLSGCRIGCRRRTPPAVQ